MLMLRPLTSEFMGMASYAPTYFYELIDDEVESDGSSISNKAPSHHPSWECAIADAPGQPPVVAESLRTHAPLDPHAEALVRALEHGKELRQRQQSQPPPAPVRSTQHAAPHACNLESGA